jgi:hypothetical protein
MNIDDPIILAKDIIFNRINNNIILRIKSGKICFYYFKLDQYN